MNKYTVVFAHFLEYVLLFLDDVMKYLNNAQLTKVQPKGVAYHLFDFLPISAWRGL